MSLNQITKLNQFHLQDRNLFAYPTYFSGHAITCIYLRVLFVFWGEGEDTWHTQVIVKNAWERERIYSSENIILSSVNIESTFVLWRVNCWRRNILIIGMCTDGSPRQIRTIKLSGEGEIIQLTIDLGRPETLA